jgi:hypothetical protein
MQKKLISKIIVNNFTDVLAILVSITVLYLIEIVSIPLDISLFIIVILTASLNIPFIFFTNYLTSIFVTQAITKRAMAMEQKKPLRIKLPFYVVLIVFFLPIISESVVLYILVKLAYLSIAFNLFDALIVIITAKTILLALKPILFGKGVGGSGF